MHKLVTKILPSVFWEAHEKTNPKSAPLMVVLHGRGDSPDGFAWMPEALAIPGLSYLMVQAPDEYYTGYSWYDLPPNQEPGILRSRKLLQIIMNELVEQGVLLKNVFLFGFSQGCLMTIDFGSRFETVLAGYIGISGYVFREDQLLSEANPLVKNADWLVTHGTRDDVLPFAETRAQIKKLIEGGFKMTYLEYPKGHTIDDQQELLMLRDWLVTRIEKL